MLSFSPLAYLKIGAVGIVLALVGLGIWQWHYKPLHELTAKVEVYEQTVIDLNNQVYTCESKAKKDSLESYIQGIGENNETTIIGLDNLHT